MNVYDVGDTVRVWGTFKAASWAVTAGVPAATYALTDPTTVTLTVITPAGVSTAYTYAAATVTKQGTGVFYRDVALTAEGAWRYHWAGTGTVAASSPSVVMSVFAQDTA